MGHIDLAALVVPLAAELLAPSAAEGTDRKRPAATGSTPAATTNANRKAHIASGVGSAAGGLLHCSARPAS